MLPSEDQIRFIVGLVWAEGNWIHVCGEGLKTKTLKGFELLNADGHRDGRSRRSRRTPEEEKENDYEETYDCCLCGTLGHSRVF